VADVLRLTAGGVAIIAALALGAFGWALAYGDGAYSWRSEGRERLREAFGVLLIAAALVGVLAALSVLWGVDPGG
jgi:hypothetical protein